MGTQMQSETYFLRHSPMSSSRNISTGRWLTYQEGKVPGNSQYKDSPSPLPGLVDRYSGDDKAKIKETILEQEATFRHQVRELHRLYRTQKELMNAVQDNKLYNFQKKPESSQSIIFPPLSSGSAKRVRDGYPILSSDSMIGQLDSSSSRAGKSPSTVLRRKNCELFNPWRGTYLHKPFNLHISGDPRMNKEKKIVEGLSLGLVGNGFRCEERAPNSFFNSVANYHNWAGDSGSNVWSNGRNHLGYLNEPFKFLRNSSVKNSGRLSCHADNVNSGFALREETCQYSMPVMNDLSLHIEHKTESLKKRKLFGVEIVEEVDVSNGAESDTSPFLPVKASASQDTRKVSSLRGSHSATTSEPTWLKLGSCLQNLEFAEDKKVGHVIEKRVDAMDHPKEVVIQLEANPNAPESLCNNISGLKNHIDLNLSIAEEGTPAAIVHPEGVVKNIQPEIDLEVAAVIESDIDHGGTESLVKSEEPLHYLIKEAAEALLAISAADIANVATYHLENQSSCLCWFADVISSYTSDEDGGIREISKGIDGCYDGEAVPDGMDFFEFMTLQLKGDKEETAETEYNKTEIPAAERRFGRGHRRGRRMKDFQKDVLPDLVSLARQEVVEDLQTLEEIFRSTGKTWKSSLSRRNRAKNGHKGIKQEANSALFPSKQKQTQLRRRSLNGRGKRTRRLPRQQLRFSIQRLTNA